MTKVTYDIDAVLKSQLKNIPSTSGIYMMTDKKGKVIYIGKALNLKSRVRSYFNVKTWDVRPKLQFMIPKVKEIKTVITRSEKEALILEANLVNKYQPKYNVTLKDDKKFPWLMISYDEKYPRVLPIRDITGFKNKYPNTKNKFFGPYSDSGAMWETYKILKEGFQLRLRRKPLFKDRPCMNYHIGLCSGPCQELISYNGYQKIVKQVEAFLLGKYDVVLKDLKNQMKEASGKLEYEKAAKIRNTIEKIKKVLEKQIVVSDDHKLTQDIFACDWSGENMVVEILVVREGKIIVIESLTIDLPKVGAYGSTSQEAFEEAIKQYYIRTQKDNIPKEIIVQFELKEKEHIEEWLTSRVIARSEATKQSHNALRKEIASSGKCPPRNDKITIICPKKGKKLDLIKMAKQNAKLSLQKVLMSNITNVGAIHELPLQEMQQELNLKNYPHQIECFDISHLGGTGTVGSMVCFMDGKPDKNQYRKFKLKTVLNKIDDFAAIKEIVSRRYRRRDAIDRVSTDVAFPDLIIIDGGKGQLSAAKEALENARVDLNKIDLISIAKKREEIFKFDKKCRGEVTSPLLDRKSQALFLIQRIRDEAHRFAITYQRDTRVGAFHETPLEKIPGLGPAKIKRLMNYFGSLQNIQEADLKIFAEVLGEKEESVKEIWEKIKKL